MLKHLVLLTWKAPLNTEQLQAIESALAELPSQIEQIRRYEFGADAGIYPGNADFALLAEFNNEAEFKTYVEHPAHQAFMKKLIKPVLASYQSIQL